MLTSSQGKKLLKLARDSIITSFYGEIPKLTQEFMDEFGNEFGVFVTLHDSDGVLRGCIGYPNPVYPIYKAIISASRSAAFQDPRFSPIKENELDKINIEVSILTIPKKIICDDPDSIHKMIKIGEDGLIIKSSFGSGLLLPQVAKEYNWSVDEFLMHACDKAGLNAFAWRSSDVSIYKFQAQIFKELN
jgi:uncharacterized protein (TIGR00296 family)